MLDFTSDWYFDLCQINLQTDCYGNFLTLGAFSEFKFNYFKIFRNF